MRKSARALAIVGIILFLSGLALLLYVSQKPGALETTTGPEPSQSTEITVRASDLDIPWKVIELPDGSLLATERSGTIRRIGIDAQTYQISGVRHVGEGGLLGLALHPRFADNGWLYVYATQETDSILTNRVDRYTYRDQQLTGRTIVIENIPGAANHDGGALEFGPDGMLYISTGDAGVESSAQDRGALSGKILRLTDEGSIPADDPFGSAVYSYGHRNPQGLTWDDRGRLWATEHGRSGAGSGYDEVNLITKGSNYGWPDIEGDEQREGMVAPVVHSGPDATWAPSGLAYSDGALYFGGLRGRAVFKVRLANEAEPVVTKHLEGQYGRIRGITASNQNLLITTSNRDGRGDPGADDDKILQIPVSSL